MRIPSAFIAVSWLPPALLAAALWELKRLEGWSGWAAAGIIVPIVLGVSALFAVIGLVLSILEWKKGNRTPTLPIATLVAVTPWLWFLARIISIEMNQGF